MHSNSLNTFYEERKRMNDRELKIFDLFASNPHNGYTDRQVMEKLGFTEPNQVRPRITELINGKKLLMESGNTKCHITGKTVRIVKLYQENDQLEMF